MLFVPDILMIRFGVNSGFVVADLSSGNVKLVMILGYAIIAVPTGIFTSELSQEMKKQHLRLDHRICSKCRKLGHQSYANYCHICGTELNPSTGQKSV